MGWGEETKVNVWCNSKDLLIIGNGGGFLIFGAYS